ncbi:MAG: hypothetical protein V4616_14365, partial [Bacteroidota bacterium]
MTLLVVFGGLRTYEFFGIISTHTPAGSQQELVFRGLLCDLVFTLQVCAVLFPVFGLFHYVSFTVGKSFKYIFSVLLFVLAFGISQYYITTSIPLGADL